MKLRNGKQSDKQFEIHEIIEKLLKLHLDNIRQRSQPQQYEVPGGYQINQNLLKELLRSGPPLSPATLNFVYLHRG
jgi:hypothetical protein